LRMFFLCSIFPGLLSFTYPFGRGEIIISISQSLWVLKEELVQRIGMAVEFV